MKDVSIVSDLRIDFQLAQSNPRTSVTLRAPMLISKLSLEISYICRQQILHLLTTYIAFHKAYYLLISHQIVWDFY
jgi:hypothetical protein